MKFDRRADLTGASCAVRTDAWGSVQAGADPCAAAAENVFDAALAARERIADAAPEEKLALLRWVLQAADEMGAAVSTSIARQRSDRLRCAA